MAEKNISAQHVQAKSDIDYSNVKRNDLCPCGSGKKFKNCHGRKHFQKKTTENSDNSLKNLLKMV